jgi:hypothetical protein
VRTTKPTGFAFGLVCVGLYLGWFFVIFIAAVTAVLVAPMWLPEPVSPRLRIPAGTLLVGVTFLGILAWAWLVWLVSG